MNTYGVDLMGRRRRRRHTAEFKAAVIEECLRPGVSIAAAEGLASMIRVDAVWLCTQPMDMRAGTDTTLARVVEVAPEIRSS